MPVATTTSTTIPQPEGLTRLLKLKEDTDAFKDQHFNLPNLKKVIPGVKGKQEFVGARSKLGTAVKAYEKLGNCIYNKKNKGTSTRAPTLINIPPKIQKFLGVSDTVYDKNLLTSWFTNYFYANKLASVENGKLIICPNKQIIDLFYDKLLADGIIDKNGEVLTRNVTLNNGKVCTVKGFEYIKHIGYISSIVPKVEKDKEKPTLTEERAAYIKKYKDIFAELKEIRKKTGDLNTKISKQQAQINVDKRGNSAKYQEKIDKCSDELYELEQRVKSLYKSVNFPNTV